MLKLKKKYRSQILKLSFVRNYNENKFRHKMGNFNINLDFHITKNVDKTTILCVNNSEKITICLEIFKCVLYYQNNFLIIEINDEHFYVFDTKKYIGKYLIRKSCFNYFSFYFNGKIHMNSVEREFTSVFKKGRCIYLMCPDIRSEYFYNLNDFEYSEFFKKIYTILYIILKNNHIFCKSAIPTVIILKICDYIRLIEFWNTFYSSISFELD